MRTIRRNPVDINVRAPAGWSWEVARDNYAALARSDPYYLYGLSFTNAIDAQGRIKLGVYPALDPVDCWAAVAHIARDLYMDGTAEIRYSDKKHAARIVATLLANCDSARLYIDYSSSMKVTATLSGSIDINNLKRATPAQDASVIRAMSTLFDSVYDVDDMEFVITNRNGKFHVEMTDGDDADDGADVDEDA